MGIDVAFTSAEAAPAPVGIVVDVLRATSTISQALAAGYRRVLCCAEIEEALALRAELPDALVGGERSAVRVEGFDVGASPREFLEARADTLILSTTNGTRTILETDRPRGPERENLRPAGSRSGHCLLRPRGPPRRGTAPGRDGRTGCRDTVGVKPALLLAALLAALALTADASAARKPWLWQCTQIHNAEAQYHCYVRLLLLDVQASRDPALELPRIDRRVSAVGGPVEASCHVLMHEVGREYAQAHHLTLSDLQRYVPRSNNPNCSAGFGMGLVMYLGPEILRSGGKAAAEACARLPTRYRVYTCVHGLGHALLRAYHGNLGEAVRACHALQRNFAPDCAQGVFHDYWISLRGADGTTRPRGVFSPRTLCDGRLTYIRPCWYRYFLERPVGLPIRDAQDLRRACRNLRGLERFGCISAAALTISTNPFDQMRVCANLRGSDAGACLRGVPDQALAGEPARQVKLIRACSRIGAGVRPDCYAWLGRTLAVVTNGTFRGHGCTKLGPTAQRDCVDGAKRMDAALVTFS